MKKTFLILALLLQTAFVFAQVKTGNGTKGVSGTAGAQQTKQYIPPANNINQNDQPYKNDCYANLAFTVKNYGYNKDGKFYSWGVKVTNKYSKAVQLRYKLIVGGDNKGNGTLTYKIQPGATYANDYGTVSAIIVNNNSTQYRIEITEVCFEGQDCIKNGYADCNGKQTGINGANGSNSIEHKANLNTQQNDLKHKNSKNELDNKKEFSFSTDNNYDISFSETLSFIQGLRYQLISQTNNGTSMDYYFNGFRVSAWSSRGGIKRGFKVERYMTAVTIVCGSEDVLNNLLKKIKCDDANITCKCVSYRNSETKQYGINIERKQ